jgi:hypothetical protein
MEPPISGLFQPKEIDMALYQVYCRTRTNYGDRVVNTTDPYSKWASFQDAYKAIIRLARLDCVFSRSTSLTYTKTTSWAIGLTAAEAYRIYTQDGLFGVVTRVWYIHGPDGQVGATTGFIKQLDRVPS